MRRRLNFRQAGILLLLALIFLLADYFKEDNNAPPAGTTSGRQVENAYIAKSTKAQVEGNGVVVKLLPDDLKGSRHQKFIVEATKDLTLLISHNIDIAPRIDDLKAGDNISFSGEYKWNNRGGLVHWTHHDPAGRHPGGWIKHKGKTYR